MHRSLTFAALAGTAAFGILGAACTDTTNTSVAAPEGAGITVSGHGEVFVAPDTAFLDLGVQISATSVAEARDRAASAAQAVIDSVKKNGVEAKDIQTAGISIQPEFFYPSDGRQPEITGYAVTNTVTVRVRKVDSTAKVIDDAAAAGGNAVLVNGIRFGVDDDEKLLQQAREAAMKDARAKAEELANLAGVKLGEPLAISETVGSQVPSPVFLDSFAASRQGAPASPIEAGSSRVSVDIAVLWAIVK